MSFLTPKKPMLLCSHMLHMEAPWTTGLRDLDHRERAGSKHLPGSVQKKISISLTIAESSRIIRIAVLRI